MRVLLAVHNAYDDHVSGAARSVRTMLEWLQQDGHACRVLATARFDRLATETTLAAHLAAFGIVPEWQAPAAPCRIARYHRAGVAVTALETQHNLLTAPDVAEAAQLVRLLDAELRGCRPDIVLSYGAHPVVPVLLQRAHAAGVATVFTLRAHGYEQPHWFRHVSRVLTCSPWLSRHYAAQVGIISTGLPSPIVGAEVLGEAATRGFVTFVNPALHKGAAAFARLADMLGRARPDIPLLIVQSAEDARALASVPGLDLARHEQIVASPPLPNPRDIFSLARILLVPSLFAEPFGRVAAEAMLNGVPVLVSDRGALPETVAEGGIVLPLPDWMQPDTRRLPDEAAMRPWLERIVALWDDDAAYDRQAAAAQATARRLYDEATLRAQYAAFFDAAAAGGSVLAPAVVPG